VVTVVPGDGRVVVDVEEDLDAALWMRSVTG
jgi:hypothetical protein